MGKGITSWETIEKLLAEGYKPRIKNIGDKKYLTARKGGDEKGLGPFNDTIWNKIQIWKKEDVRNNKREASNSLPLYSIYLFSAKKIPTPTEAKFSRIEIDDALFEIKLERARVKGRDCKYRRFESCGYWKFNEDAEKLDKIYERYNEKSFKLPIDAKHKWQKYHINELLCFDCDKFLPREADTSSIKQNLRQ